VLHYLFPCLDFFFFVSIFCVLEFCKILCVSFPHRAVSLKHWSHGSMGSTCTLVSQCGQALVSGSWESLKHFRDIWRVSRGKAGADERSLFLFLNPCSLGMSFLHLPPLYRGSWGQRLESTFHLPLKSCATLLVTWHWGGWAGCPISLPIMLSYVVLNWIEKSQWYPRSCLGELGQESSPP
jgi:hypothetical protein